MTPTPPNEQATLRPCPFCEGEADFGGQKYPFVGCMSCGAQTGLQDTEAEARRAWNTRPIQSRLKSKLDLKGSENSKLRKALENIAAMPLIPTHAIQHQDLVKSLIQDPWIVSECGAKGIARSALSKEALRTEGGE